MSIVKTKTLINDLLTYNNKLEAGGVQLEKNIIECKKIQKTIKLKNKDIESKVSKNEEVTSQKYDVEQLTNDLTNLYSDRLVILIGVKEFNLKTVTDRLKMYSTKIEEYSNELTAVGEQQYNVYKKQETDKIEKTSKERNIMSRDDYYAKFIGNHEKSNIERKLSYELYKLYDSYKTNMTSTEIKSNIIEKETMLKMFHIKQNIKQINMRQMAVLIKRVKELTNIYIDEMKTLLNMDDNKLQNFNIFVKSKNVKSSKTNIYKNMIRFSEYYKLIIDKSKDEKNVEMDFLDIPDDKTVKNFTESNQTLKFILEKNSISSYLNKEFKSISVDNKTKNFLTYLIIVHFYNDILPLLNISRKHNISYKKKTIIQNANGESSTQLIDTDKNVGVVFNRLHPNVIANVWNPLYTIT